MKVSEYLMKVSPDCKIKVISLFDGEIVFAGYAGEIQYSDRNVDSHYMCDGVLCINVL